MAKVNIKVNINGHEIGTISAEVGDSMTSGQIRQIVEDTIKKDGIKSSVTLRGDNDGI